MVPAALRTGRAVPQSLPEPETKCSARRLAGNELLACGAVPTVRANGRDGANAGGVLGTQLIKDRGTFRPPYPSPHAGWCPSERRLPWSGQATGSEYWGLKIFGCIWCILAVLELLRTAYWVREGSSGLVGSCSFMAMSFTRTPSFTL